MKTKNIIILLFTFLFFTKVFSIDKKESSLGMLSFLYVKQDSLISKEFEQIEKLFDKDEYTESFERALNLLKLNIDPETQYKTTFLIAKIFRNNNNHKKSINYFLKSLEIISKKDVSIETSIDQINKDYFLVETYYNLGTEYLRLEKVDSARYFYTKVLEFNKLNNDLLTYKARSLSTLSGIYMEDALYKVAKDYAFEAISIHRKINDKISESAALGNLANIYLSENNFDKAKKTFNEALELIKYERSNRALRIREQLYFNLAYNLYKLKDYEAYTVQEKSYIIKDSLRNIEIRKMLEDLDFKYDFNSKKEIIIKQEEVKRLEDQRKFMIIGIVALLVIISLIYIIKLNKLNQKNLELNLEQTKLIQNQNLDKLKSESQVRILNATIDGKESERKQIAETLHDSVSALLSSANLHLQATRKQFNGTTPVEIDKTQEIILEASHKIRDLSHTLVSSVLLKFGLNFAIKDIAEKYSNSQLEIETDIANIIRYHQNFEIKVYNIIHEFINNILKHSNAKKAKIEMIGRDNILSIVISDNGLGFDKTKIDIKEGLGINQIDARIQMMKGKFFIDSDLNKGTKIFIELPILEKEKPSHV